MRACACWCVRARVCIPISASQHKHQGYESLNLKSVLTVERKERGKKCLHYGKRHQCVCQCPNINVKLDGMLNTKFLPAIIGYVI